MGFVRVADATEIADGHGALFEADGRAVAVFNAGAGRFYATSPLCPHQDGPLAEGWIESDVIVCPWHGWDFELESGRCRVDARLAIAVYDVRVREGAVEVNLP